MALITHNGKQVRTSGDLPSVGSDAPGFELAAADLGTRKLSDFAGKPVVLNIYPSIDTWVCAASVREFNRRAADTDATVLCISADLPYAQSRFCGAEGIEGVETLSTFRSPAFGDDYGVRMLDGTMAELLARAVVVIGPDGKVVYTEMVPEIVQEPDYDAALAAI